MMQIQKKTRAAVAAAALSVLGAACKSSPERMEPGSKSYQAAIAKAERERPYYDKRFHPYHIADLEKEYTDRYNNAKDVDKGLAAARLGAIKNIAGKHAEAKALLLEALGKMEDLNVSGSENFLSKNVNLQNLSNFRGTPWERAANRNELAIAAINTGDQGNARAALRGALEHLSHLKKELAPESSKDDAGAPKSEDAKVAKGAEGETRVVEPEAVRSSMGVFVSIFAAKLSVNLFDQASAESYLNQAKLFDQANQKAGLPAAEIPTLEDLAKYPLFVGREGISPMVIKLGVGKMYRDIVPGRSPGSAFEFAAGGEKVMFSAKQPTGSLTAEAQMEAKAKIDEYVEDKEIRADSRYVGFAYGNDYYAKVGKFPAGETTLTFNAENNPYVGGLFSDGTFVRDGGSIKLDLKPESIVVFWTIPDYPLHCTTPEQAAELNKKNANKNKPASGAQKFLERVLDNSNRR